MIEMFDREMLWYPRGFLLTTSAVNPPAGFVEGPLLDNLWVHPWTQTEWAADSTNIVVIIGVCAITGGSDVEPPSSMLLSALEVSDARFFQVLNDFTGRFAIIFGSRSRLRIVTDATGMRSVFYGSESQTVASHAALVRLVDFGDTERDTFPFQFGYPGNRTPYSAVRLLTPNTYLDVRSGAVTRFWPNAKPADRSVDEVAEEIVLRAGQGMRRIAGNRNVRVALTAGLDSRVMLALARYSGIEFETYTYGSKRDTAVDRAFAVDLANAFDVRHSTVVSNRPRAETKLQLTAANYQPHHINVVEGLMEWFPGIDSLAVTGNLLEIGRSFFTPLMKDGVAAPTNPEKLATLHRLKMRWSMREKIAAQGVEEWHNNAAMKFSEFAQDTGFITATEFIDPFDLFYWEHRMGAWHGPAMNERDFYAEAFIPLNVRSIFEAMLGIEPALRVSGAVFYRILEMLDPRLLEFPINPKRWPY